MQGEIKLGTDIGWIAGENSDESMCAMQKAGRVLMIQGGIEASVVMGSHLLPEW